MSDKPKVIIIGGYGFNCEEETKFAFDLAGAASDIVHINDLISDRKILGRYRILVIPGGFSYGDDTGSGNAMAMKMRNHLSDDLMTFISKDRLVLGICNGFQVLINAGLLPGFKGRNGERSAALVSNKSNRYIVRWTDLQIYGKSPWITGIKSISLPIAHGEGRFIVSADVMTKLKKNKQITMKYVKGEYCRYFNLPANPTGTTGGIAAVTDQTGRILGMMPHPERAVFFTHLPDWTYRKELLLRNGGKIPVFGPGMKIFTNAVAYFH